MQPFRILTWPTHAACLYYPSHILHTLYVITNAPEHAGAPWNVRDNVHAIGIDQARKSEFDCILFQNAGPGRGAQCRASERFSIRRFVADWNVAL